ncbi:MAG: APC family permease [Candidatus Babeliales bacterium]
MIKDKISILTAISLNINVIVGSAFFLGAPIICKTGGGILAPFSWLFWGLIIFPIVLVLAKLSTFYTDAGGIYIYAKRELGSFWSFLSGWGYFIGMVAGNTIIIHKFSEYICKYLFLKINILLLDILLITFFTILNLANINFLEKTNLLFAVLKTIPLIFVVISSLFLFKSDNIISAPINFSDFFSTIPFVIFGYIGFEVCCSVAHQIKNGKKNTSKAILISFASIMLIYFVIQFCFLAIFGVSTNQPFLEIFPKLTSNNLMIFIGNRLIEATIMSSFLGGFYGAFYSNNWILYSMAQNKELPFYKHIIKLNKFQMPNIAIIIQGILTIIFLFITQQAYNLISMSDFAVAISYLLSTIAFLFIYLKNKETKNKLKNIIIGLFAFLSCCYLLFYCAKELIESQQIIFFLIIIFSGILFNKFTKKKAYS